MKYKDYLLLANCLDDESLNALKSAKVPTFVGGCKVPQDLNALTLEELFSLQDCKTDYEIANTAARVVLGFDEEEILFCDVWEVCGFCNFVGAQLKKISELFAAIKVQPTSEEVQAGCRDLDFGAFGVVDWYALRMGITDHDEAAKTKWVVVYQCMKNDNAKAMYERRLRDVYARKNKLKK